MDRPCVGFSVEPCFHVCQGLRICLRLKGAANLSNKDGKEVTAIALIVQVAKGVVHSEPKAFTLISLHIQLLELGWCISLYTSPHTCLSWKLYKWKAGRPD